jgi:hypothetical protein
MRVERIVLFSWKGGGTMKISKVKKWQLAYANVKDHVN